MLNSSTNYHIYFFPTWKIKYANVKNVRAYGHSLKKIKNMKLFHFILFFSAIFARSSARLTNVFFSFFSWSFTPDSCLILFLFEKFFHLRSAFDTESCSSQAKWSTDHQFLWVRILCINYIRLDYDCGFNGFCLCCICIHRIDHVQEGVAVICTRTIHLLNLRKNWWFSFQF